jgi:hypothetical protein
MEVGERLDFACTKGQSETGNIAVDSFFPALLDFNRKIKTIAILCSVTYRFRFESLGRSLRLFHDRERTAPNVLSKYSEEGDR